MKPNNKRYCSKCGNLLLTETVGAETIKESSYMGSSYHPHTAYDPMTGMRNWATRYYCPNVGWFGSHTDFKRRAYLLKD